MDELASSPLRLRVLGGFQLTGADGADLSPPGKKLRALIALLALAPAGGWSRERLTAFLWGDRDEEQARGSLRQALAELRRSLGESALQSDRDTVAFDPSAIYVDAREFAELATAGEAAKADALYNGDLLDGVSLPDAEFADWLLIERTRLHDIEVKLLGRLLTSQSGETVAATSQRLLHLEPANECAHRALMRHYASTGDRAHALRQFHLCRDTLQRDLNIKPEPETEKLFKELQSAAHNGVSTPTVQPIGRSSGPGPEQSDGHSENVAEPAAVYRAALGIVSRASAARRRRTAIWIAAVAILVLILVIGLSPVRYRLFPPPVPDEGVPKIVVLPFKDLTGSQAGEVDYARVGAGIAEEFTSDLSTFPDFQVVSSATAFTYADKSIPQIVEATGATFVVEGSIRHSGGTALVTVRVINGKSDTYSNIAEISEPITDPVVLQKQVVEQVRDQLGGLTGQLRAMYEKIAWSKPDAELTEYDYYIRGHTFHLKDNVFKAAEQYRLGLQRFPQSRLLYCKLSLTFGYDSNDALENLQIAEKLKSQSRLDDWYLPYTAARTYAGHGQLKLAVTKAREVVKMSPYDPVALSAMSWIMADGGQLDDAIAWAQFSVAHDPHPDRWQFENLRYAYTVDGHRWNDAVAFALGEIEKNPPKLKLWYDFLGTAYTRSGQWDKGQEAWKKMAQLPDLP
jgi:DNA-binding SARP family transcriptional activator/TolB-like protein